MKKIPMTIYFDMDGVLADFQGYLRKHHPDLPKDLFSIPDDEFWKLVRAIPDFWENLEPIKGAKELFEFAHDNFEEIAILSSPSRHDSRSISGKVTWLNKNIGDPNDGGRIYERNFVRANKKKFFANKTSVLIDDLDENINEFKGAGGHTIHFKNASQALKELKTFTKKGLISYEEATHKE
jgi:5'(3')-deoxyribonucleotidase